MSKALLSWSKHRSIISICWASPTAPKPDTTALELTFLWLRYHSFVDAEFGSSPSAITSTDPPTLVKWEILRTSEIYVKESCSRPSLKIQQSRCSKCLWLSKRWISQSTSGTPWQHGSASVNSVLMMISPLRLTFLICKGWSRLFFLD